MLFTFKNKHKLKRLASISILTVGAFSMFANTAYAVDDSACSAINSMVLPEVTSISAEMVSGGQLKMGDNAPITNLPSFCKVNLVVDPAIAIEVWLPSDTWNGRFKGVGGGGYAGSISYPGLAGALRHGYATASTNTGHAGPHGGSGSFAFNDDGSFNEASVVDFASRSLIQLTSKAKAIVSQYYAKPAEYSYWQGCSTGGRQGLIQIQRTPLAYDGVLAGAPAINWERFIAAELWPQVVYQEELGAPLPSCKFELANKAVLEACDSADGVMDGILENPASCTYNLEPIMCNSDAEADCDCLTKNEATAIRKIWQGPVGKDGNSLWAGLPRSAPYQGIAGDNVFIIAAEHAKWVKGDKDFDWKTIGYDEYEGYFKLSQTKLNAMIGSDNPKINAFKDGGGKLLMWHGWADQLIFPQGTIGYYQNVAAENGGIDATKDFARLFMAPGVAHCAGGPGADAFGQPADNSKQNVSHPDDPAYSMFHALVQWVEKDIAPDQIIATKYSSGDDPEELSTHLMCTYPMEAIYSGSGDTNDAASYSCGMAN